MPDDRLSRRRPGRRALWASALGLLALSLTSACGSQSDGSDGQGPKAVIVQTIRAKGQTLPRIVSAVGSIESPEPTTIAAEVPGTLVLLDVPEGRRVAAGHVLARIDDAEFRAAVAADRARSKNSEERLARVRRLHAQGVASDQALDDATSSYDAARAALDESMTRLRKTTIRAPFDGALGLRQASRGDYVEAGDPIVGITQIDPLDLVFGVPQHFASQVAVGQTVLGTLGRCEGRFEAHVTAVDPRIDPATRTVQIEAQVPNQEGHLAPGMAARVRLLTGEMPGSIVLPQEAVVRQGTKHLVYVVGDEHSVATREVSLGEFFADGVQIRSGVSAGEEVVVAGQDKLHPGTPVEIRPYEPTKNPLLDLGWLGPEDGCEP